MAASFLLAAQTRALDARTASVEGSSSTLLSLGIDVLVTVVEAIESYDVFAFALVSTLLNAARRAAGRTKMRTTIVSTVRSQALYIWARGLGCPSPYPHWAQLDGCDCEELNGRFVRVEGPADVAHGRQPVSVDASLAAFRELPFWRDGAAAVARPSHAMQRCQPGCGIAMPGEVRLTTYYCSCCCCTTCYLHLLHTTYYLLLTPYYSQRCAVAATSIRL